jgi:PPOX class probable F420-dependent enzyme
MRNVKRYVVVVTLLVGLGLAAVGVWALAAPDSFAGAVNFPAHRHFVHDVGAFQFGIGATLLLALIWSDALATALAGFLVGNTVHAVNHAVDGHLGGHRGDALALAALSVVTAVALAGRLRANGYVVGSVGTASTPALAPFVRQKTILLTTFRRDGTPVGTPVSIAVDGERAVVRSYERAGKTRRLRRDPAVEVAPSTARGRPTGPAIGARVRRLTGAEATRAGRALARKHPILHGVFVPLAHRLARSRTGPTVHFELIPDAVTRQGGVEPTTDRSSAS